MAFVYVPVKKKKKSITRIAPCKRERERSAVDSLSAMFPELWASLVPGCGAADWRGG